MTRCFTMILAVLSVLAFSMAACSVDNESLLPANSDAGAKKANGQPCPSGSGSECQSGICTNDVCMPAPSSCTDNVKDGSETDVDCGGATCPKCADGKKCVHGSDCVSSVCTNGICEPVPTGVCAGKTKGTECRPAVSECDVAETCDGTSSDCPVDGFKPAGTTCDSNGGTCNGTDSTCYPATGLCSNKHCPDGYICDPTDGACVLPAEVNCHGAQATFNPADLVGASCLGWEKKQVVNGVVLTPNVPLVPVGNIVTGINGTNGSCGITCSKNGITLEPIACSYVWVANGAADVPRYSTPGCCQMPDHPTSEAPQYGCTFDGRCADFCPPGP